ncbi:hypothetical protein ABZ078_28295 [Streptomyces sp. NPDC006385]|uniref:hypothetical protein n=1 Tax=Streptomyces sp. NPDC006385 TaxID=3156761 RepID=UPI0033BFB2AF
MIPESANATLFEKRCARVFREMCDAPGVNVSEAEFGEIRSPFDDPAVIFRRLESSKSLPLGSEVQRNFFRFHEIKMYWRSSRPDSHMVGEFHLTHLYRSVAGNHVSNTREGKTDRERELYDELRIFDDTPSTGTGRLTALRVVNGSSNPEIWFFDMRPRTLPMDLDYGAYLDTLLATKGTIGWQYLFCDVEFGDPGFTPVVKGLAEMLEVFPQLFPDYDYSDLKARFRERT